MSEIPRPPQLQVDTEAQHPLWIPGQTYPKAVVTRIVQRGSHLCNLDSTEPLPVVSELAAAPLFHDAVAAALADYQGVHQVSDGKVFFPFAFSLAEGQVVTDEKGAPYHVTKLLKRAGGGPYWNPYYRFACGQVARLDPVPSWDAVLRLPETAELLYCPSFPDEVVTSYLQRTQLEHCQGFSTRIVASTPFTAESGITERYGFRRQTGIRDPHNPHIQYEMREFRDLTTYEFSVFASRGWVADELLRYLGALLWTYEPSFRQLGIDGMFPTGRGADAHISRGADQQAFKSDLHIRRTLWQVQTSEALLTMQRVIDRLSFTVRTFTGRGTDQPRGGQTLEQPTQSTSWDQYPDGIVPRYPPLFRWCR